ncbi:MAG: hypothetical protein Q8N69_02530 [bacterium]|nr:hypothetical protein [bacterium]
MKRDYIKNKGMAMTELLVYLFVFVLISMIIIAFIFTLINSIIKAKVDKETLDNANRIMKIIISEIKEAEYIYTPTSSPNQLSLKTSRYAGSDENSSYIDFFLCGTNICFKKEFSDPIIINTEKVEVSNLVFEIISTGGIDSVKIILDINYKDEGRPILASSVNLMSAASIR